MCVNADESEPATFNNRLLMEKDPHQFLEGILIACFATKATTAYVYLRFEYIHAYQHPRGGDRRGPGRRAPGQEHLRDRASTWTSGSTAGPGPTSAARRPG